MTLVFLKYDNLVCALLPSFTEGLDNTCKSGMSIRPSFVFGTLGNLTGDDGAS